MTETSARLVYENRYFPLVARYRARSSRRVGSLTADNPLDATALREDISFRTIRVAAQNRVQRKEHGIGRGHGDAVVQRLAPHPGLKGGLDSGQISARIHPFTFRGRAFHHGTGQGAGAGTDGGRGRKGAVKSI